jgi:hypothetical protein
MTEPPESRVIVSWRCMRLRPSGYHLLQAGTRSEESPMLLILAIVLLIVAIAGGVIIHPILFALALVAIAMYFSGHRGTIGSGRRGYLR